MKSRTLSRFLAAALVACGTGTGGTGSVTGRCRPAAHDGDD